MQSGDVVDLDVTGVAHGGVFVAREEGLVVFVPDALPGERIRARITEVKKSFARAEALEVLDASPDRRPHVWAQADISTAPEARPGGADFGHISLPRQRALKAQVLREAFERFAGTEIDVEVRGPEDLLGGDHPTVRGTADGTHYRTRVSLHVDAEGRIGPYAARSHTVIPVDAYPLATPEIEAVALAVRKAPEGRIDLVQPADGAVRTIRRAARTGDRRRRFAPKPERVVPEVVTERVGDREFQVDAGAFWQVHRAAAATLDRAVRDALGELSSDAWHLDLYGGVGLFAAALGDLAGSARITTVESEPRATAHAERNLEEFGAEAVTARVDRFLSRVSNQASLFDREMLTRGVTLLDPPRSGAGREVVEGIADLGSSRVAYVACDPVALARDVGYFRASGYELQSIQAYDLFPNSHHVEAVAILQR
ncbi:class I SAM-dependent RNA methyltransferase [Microbacterium paludicola]|uniref:Class I SAM-dependent RNA methyltransferase n=1 Tax=Microbacterium paludicola TaxID=300019 RepID=A0A4Y9FMH5_9MICO|nr:TRAM domain-containing protein [Microbacterium paludicola]MBF0817648.1 class I SAM-dependent RNA methyltransferase [Microbacterium paludicola]TFU30414.1 class I SAM-dependent RNA methyltransferase [Microbacterium paludicola]